MFKTIIILSMAVALATGSPSGRLPEDCPEGTIECQYGGRCIRPDQICDGIPDCVVGEDEIGDDPKCCSLGFLCAHGNKCIILERVCNGLDDCNDWSDEQQNCNGTTVRPTTCHGFFC